MKREHWWIDTCNGLRPVPLAIGLGLIGIVLAAYAPLTMVLAYLAVMAGLVVGLALALLGSMRSTETLPRQLQLLIELAGDREISEMQMSIAEALRQIANRRDPIFRQQALACLQSISEQCSVIGEGTIEFTSTESWRIVYEELLRSPGLHLYRSVAHVESAHYWQDGPGRQSMQLNLELQDQGVVSIERIAIIADYLWPETSLFPNDPIHTWLDEQHRHGIWIRLVRESSLAGEQDLLDDFGIYGSRAVGMQSAEPSGRTLRFVLSFDFEKVRQAEAQWDRLVVYAVPYRELLDQRG